MRRLVNRHVAEQFARSSDPGLSLLRKPFALLAAALALLAAHWLGLLTPLDNALFAFRTHLLTRAPTGTILVVEIDPHSINAAGVWPWPRERFATAVKNLRNAGAILIGFDVDFSAKSTDAQDHALADEIGHDPGSIVLPIFVQTRERMENSPLAALSNSAILGTVNVPVDPDGQVRRYFRGSKHDDHFHASMASVLAGSTYGRTDSFLIDFGIHIDRLDHLSFEDVFQNSFDPARVRGKSVLIGATAMEFGDSFSTPVAPTTPGVYLHALAAESLKQNRALIPTSDLVSLVIGFATLLALWPKPEERNLVEMGVRHLAFASAGLFVPVLLQAAFPVSADTACVFFAQGLCLWVTVRQELSRRANEVIVQRESHLRYAALHDAETGLPNRRAMLEELELKIAAQRDGDPSIIIAIALGVDRFALLRGAIGYVHAHDLMLRLSERFCDFSQNRRIYHLSTSIIALIATARSVPDAHKKCADMVASTDSQVSVAGQLINTTLRLGASLCANAELTAEQTLENASMALDHARMKNRKHVTFEPEHITDPRRQLALLSDISRGLKNNEFKVVFQPKISLKEGTIQAAEALLRWHHSEFGPIPPDEFIRTAEQTDAIGELTHWVLEQSITALQQLDTQLGRVGISVNISGSSLSDPKFCEDVIQRTRGIESRLCLEITETAIIGDPASAIESIARFRSAGLQISVDDYGAGLSSLSYLKQINADELKIDRSLVSDLRSNARDRLIIKSTIDLAHGLGMSVVAEGVEDLGTHATLALLGCDYIQGYLISRPLPLPAFLAFCERWSEEQALLGMNNVNVIQNLSSTA